MPEMLDIVDENGLPTGQAVPRTVAHAEGLRHRTSHVWIVRKKNGAVQVLLQMRCAAKDSYPGCYDISSAGHIPAGAEFVGSALRELKEELGVQARLGAEVPGAYPQPPPTCMSAACAASALKASFTASRLRIIRSARCFASGWIKRPRTSPCSGRRSTM